MSFPMRRSREKEEEVEEEEEEYTQRYCDVGDKCSDVAGGGSQVQGERCNDHSLRTMKRRR